MEGYPQVMKLYAGAMDSAGTTTKKMDLYMQGNQATINKLKNDWQGLWTSAFNSSAIKLVVGGLDSMAKVLKTTVDHVGLLPPALAIAGVAMIAFNGGVKSIMTNGTLMIAMLKGMPTSFGRVNSSIAAATLGTNILNGATKTLTVSMGALKTAGTFLMGALLPMAAFMAIGYAIQKITEYLAKQRQEEEQLQKQQKELVDSYKGHKEEISKLIKEYESLTKLKNNGGLNAEQEKKYVDVQNQLAKILPTVKEGETAKGDAVLKSSKAIKDQIELLKEQIKQQKKQSELQAPTDIKNNTSKITDAQKEVEKQKNLASEYDRMVKNGEKDKINQSIILGYKQSEQEATILAGNAQAKIDAQRLKNAQLIKNYFNNSKIDDASITRVSAALSKISLKGKNDGEIDTFFKSVSVSVDKLNTALENGNKKGIKQAENSLSALGVKGKVLDAIIAYLIDSQNKHSKSAKDGSKAMDGEAFSADQLSKKLADAKGSFTKTKDAIMDMVKSKEYDMAVSATQNQAYSEMSSKLSPINGLLEDLAQGHTVSAAAAMDLIQKVPELTKYLSIENGQVAINTQGIITYRDAQVASFQDMINAEKTQIDAQSKGLKTKLANYGVEIQAILSVAQANDALAEAEKKHADNVAKINGSGASGSMHASMVEQGQYDGVVSGVNKIKDAYSQLDQLSSMASTGLTQVGTSLEKTGNSEKQSTYITDKYKQSIEELSTALEKLKYIQQQYPNSSQAYRDALKQEIDLLKQQKELTDNQAKNLQSQISSGHILQTGMISGSSSSYSGYSTSGGGNASQIWSFLKSKGFSDSAAAGIMGNLQVESGAGFSTTIKNPTSGATGIAQWLGGRLTSLKQQSNWTSLDTQLNFLWSELQNGYLSRMGGMGNFNSLDASQAAYIFEKIFEVSGGSLNSKRIANAQSILSQFGGSSGSYTGGSGSQSAADAAQALDQAKSDLLGLQKDSMDLQSQIQDLYMQIVQSKVAEFDNIKKQYDAQIAQYDYLQSVQDKNGADWLHTQMNREAAYTQQIKAEQDSIDYLQQEIKYNNDLTAAQKQTLSDDVLQRQQDLIGLEQKLYDTRLQMANDIVDTYKQALQDMKDAATKSIDNMINELNKQADSDAYKKKLADAQKSAQDIQDEINKLMLDDSNAAKKRVADLQKQLADQQDSISQMVADNNKQTQIDNLNTQKETLSTYYDNMLNDEDKFAQMRTDILKVSNQSVIDELNSLSAQVQSNVNVLGTSVVNTLIDAINRANGYMGLSTQNTDVIGHIASLDVGGITPSWGSSGKLAVLHQDEMISNKLDTNNFLKSINLVRDLVTNFIKPLNLNGVLSPANASGGNVYNLNLKIDNLNGNQQGADLVWNKLVNGIKTLGGDI